MENRIRHNTEIILFYGFKIWLRFAKFVANIFKMRKKMYDGSEGVILSEQEFSDGIQNYSNSQSQSTSFTKFEVIGRNFIESNIFVPGCVAVRFYNIIGQDGQTGIVAVPVDSDGNELPVNGDIVARGGDGKGGGGSVGPKCPTSCP